MQSDSEMSVEVLLRRNKELYDELDDLRQQISTLAAENHDLIRIICEAVNHGVYEQNAKYWDQLVQVWRKHKGN